MGDFEKIENCLVKIVFEFDVYCFLNVFRWDFVFLLDKDVDFVDLFVIIVINGDVKV